jgi:hypothetical protein
VSEKNLPLNQNVTVEMENWLDINVLHVDSATFKKTPNFTANGIFNFNYDKNIKHENEHIGFIPSVIALTKQHIIIPLVLS